MSDNLTQRATLPANPLLPADLLLPSDLFKLRARWVFPVSSPPIADGIVEVGSDRIVSVRPASAEDRATERLDAAIFPGFVNAHTHLEFSDLSQPIGQPGIPLHQWIGEVVRARHFASATDPARAIASGMQECLDAATALIGEIATTPWSCRPLSDHTSGLEVVAFAEVLGLFDERVEERFAQAIDHAERFASSEIADGGPYPAVSPHAPYSTPMPWIEKCVDLAVTRGMPLAMHLAESIEERELLEHGTGGLTASLSAMGLSPERWFSESRKQSLMSILEVLAKAPRAALIHGNFFNEEEIGFISQNAGMSVVMCPRTHAFFEHPRHPIDRMLAVGVNVALGTDSRASNPDLSVWREAQFLLNHRQDLPPESILQCATLAGSRALGQESRLGSLEAGKLARVALLPTVADSLEAVYRDCSQRDAVTAGDFMPRRSGGTSV